MSIFSCMSALARTALCCTVTPRDMAQLESSNASAFFFQKIKQIAIRVRHILSLSLGFFLYSFLLSYHISSGSLSFRLSNSPRLNFIFSLVAPRSNTVNDLFVQKKCTNKSIKKEPSQCLNTFGAARDIEREREGESLTHL